MLGKSITFKALLRVAGVLCLLWVIYQAFSIATMPTSDGSSQQTNYLIQTDWPLALYLMIYAHLHWFLAAAIILLSLSIGRARVIYLGFQVSLWIIGLSIWDYTNNSFDPWPLNPDP